MTIEIMPPGADLFASGAEVLVNPVDAATGAQGKGLARAFAQRWPSACVEYRKVARRGAMRAGGVWVYELPFDGRRHWIFFAATKQHWRQASSLADIGLCARHIRQEAISLGAKSIAIPALGCGEGGLAWDEVREILEVEAEAMVRAGIKVMIYEPHVALADKQKGLGR